MLSECKRTIRLARFEQRHCFRDKLDPFHGNRSREFIKHYKINEERFNFTQDENRSTQIYILGTESTRCFLY